MADEQRPHDDHQEAIRRVILHTEQTSAEIQEEIRISRRLLEESKRALRDSARLDTPPSDDRDAS